MRERAREEVETVAGSEREESERAIPIAFELVSLRVFDRLRASHSRVE